MEVKELSAKYLSWPHYQQTEIGWLPEDWEVSTLGKMCVFENGDRGKNYPSGVPTAPNGVPFVNAGHIAEGRIRLSELNYISRESFDLLGSGKFKPGDILFCLRGSLGKFGVVNEDFGEGAIASSLVIIRPKSASVTRTYLNCYFSSHHCAKMIELWSGGAAQPNLGAQDLARFTIPLPRTKAEQEAIAEALSDADALIESLEQLLAKKRNIKQGTMQELLTGKKRLPGFEGDWETRWLGDVCQINTGSKDVNEGNADGLFPFFTCSRSHTFSDSYSFDTEAILIAGNGDVGNLHYYKGKFEAYQRTYVVSGFTVDVGYLLQQLTAYLEASLGLGKIGSSIPYIRKGNLIAFSFRSPKSEQEQIAIASTLADMDAEIVALEDKLTKARQIKQGMMQELLTGRVRLV